jgi:hypothetical protein
MPPRRSSRTRTSTTRSRHNRSRSGARSGAIWVVSVPVPVPVHDLSSSGRAARAPPTTKNSCTGTARARLRPRARSTPRGRIDPGAVGESGSVGQKPTPGAGFGGLGCPGPLTDLDPPSKKPTPTTRGTVLRCRLANSASVETPTTLAESVSFLASARVLDFAPSRAQ